MTSEVDQDEMYVRRDVHLCAEVVCIDVHR